jgi:hypothetical protein
MRDIYLLGIWLIIVLSSACKSERKPLVQNGCSANTVFSITAPTNGDTVGMVPTVQGTFGVTDAEILVVVHPLAEGANQVFWLQRPTTKVQPDCSWNVAIHVGEPDTHDEKFEIEAFEHPQTSPSRLTVPNWPAAEAHSNLITVSRK